MADGCACCSIFEFATVRAALFVRFLPRLTCRTPAAAAAVAVAVAATTAPMFVRLPENTDWEKTRLRARNPRLRSQLR